MNDLVSDILEFNKINSGKVKIRKESLNLDELINESINDHNYLISNLKHTIINNSPNLYVEVDKVFFKSVLDNLISNALKYTPKNGEIKIEAKKEKEKLKMSLIFFLTLF